MTGKHAGKAGRQRLRMVAGVLALVLPAAPLSALPAGASTVNCGDVLTSSVALTADLDCPVTGPQTVTVNAANITIDLAGHTLTADLVNDTFPGVTVKDGRLSSLSTDHNATVTLSNVRTASVSIKNLATVIANGTPDTCEIGTVRVNVGRLTVDNCTLHRGNFYRALPIVRSSVVSDGSLSFTDSNDGLFTENIFDNAPVSVGWESVDFTFRDNVFKNADKALNIYGISRGPWSSGTVENNEFVDNSIGLHAAPYFDRLTVRNNTFTRNRTVGLYIDNQTTPRQSYPVSDNVFNDNGQAPSGATDRWHNPLRGGLHVANNSGADGPPYFPRITLTRNTGSGNANYLIWAPRAQVIDGGGNQGPCKPGDTPLTCF
ncbi:right-handed parallel beta-helix repeat-containing protein [Streptosporangium sp. NPDC051022]|uniref:right-handed parallel beta-helix repeat-containing protein n=1 Tax=Streptosporangium sp. NPDC051022 TaxID=3155752 RepID=UPI00343D24EA